MNRTSRESVDNLAVDRRRFLGAALGACATSPLSSWSMQFAASMSGSLTKEQRDSMTPLQVIDELKKGNERFRAGKMAPRDYLAQKRSSAAGQYPAAIILGCVDSRVPAEIIFDAGIGDTFNGRVAGNVVNDDQLGSMEFACAVSGSKLVLVLGHTACGAIKGAIDDVVLGNLTGLLARIKPAIPETKFVGESPARIRLTSTLSPEPMSNWQSKSFGGEARYWRIWRRKDRSRSLVRCTTSRMGWWISSVSEFRGSKQTTDWVSREATGLC